MKRWTRGGVFLAVAGGAVALLPGAAQGQAPMTAEYASQDSPLRWLSGASTDVTIAQGGRVTFTVPGPPDSLDPGHNVDFTGTTDPTCEMNGSVTTLPMPFPAARGWTGTCTFSQPGAYPFICFPHRNAGMRGTITVEPTTTTPGPPGGTDPGSPQPGGGTPPPAGGTPTQPGGTTAPGLAATSLKLAKRQTGTRLRGSVDVRERGSRLRVDALVRRTVLGQRRSGRVRVGRLVRSSVGPGRVAFALGLQAKARKVLGAGRKLAVQVRITVIRPGASRRTWTRSVTLAAR